MQILTFYGKIFLECLKRIFSNLANSKYIQIFRSRTKMKLKDGNEELQKVPLKARYFFLKVLDNFKCDFS